MDKKSSIDKKMLLARGIIAVPFAITLLTFLGVWLFEFIDNLRWWPLPGESWVGVVSPLLAAVPRILEILPFVAVLAFIIGYGEKKAKLWQALVFATLGVLAMARPLSWLEFCISGPFLYGLDFRYILSLIPENIVSWLAHGLRAILLFVAAGLALKSKKPFACLIPLGLALVLDIFCNILGIVLMFVLPVFPYWFSNIFTSYIPGYYSPLGLLLSMILVVQWQILAVVVAVTPVLLKKKPALPEESAPEEEKEKEIVLTPEDREQVSLLSAKLEIGLITQEEHDELYNQIMEKYQN